MVGGTKTPGWSTCFDEKLCSVAFPSPVYGFDELSLSTHSLIIRDKGPNGAALFDKDGVRKINITQIVFDELAAALLYFERMKELFPCMEGFHKAYVWRIVARSRKKATVLPPGQYDLREGEVLQEFPQHLWFKRDNEPSV